MITVELTEDEANFVAEAAYREISGWDECGRNPTKKPHIESAIAKLYKAAGSRTWTWPFVVKGNKLIVGETEISVVKVSLLNW